MASYIYLLLFIKIIELTLLPNPAYFATQSYKHYMDYLVYVRIYHLTSIVHYIRSKQNVMTNKLKLSLVSEPKIRHIQTAKLHQIYHKVVMRS